MRGQAATERREVDLARMTLLEGGTVLRIEGGVGRHFARQLPVCWPRTVACSASTSPAVVAT